MSETPKRIPHGGERCILCRKSFIVAKEKINVFGKSAFDISSLVNVLRTLIYLFIWGTCLDTRQPGSVYKKLDTREPEILTSFLEIAGLIPLRT